MGQIEGIMHVKVNISLLLDSYVKCLWGVRSYINCLYLGKHR